MAEGQDGESQLTMLQYQMSNSQQYVRSRDQIIQTGLRSVFQAKTQKGAQNT